MYVTVCLCVSVYVYVPVCFALSFSLLFCILFSNNYVIFHFSESNYILRNPIYNKLNLNIFKYCLLKKCNHIHFQLLQQWLTYYRIEFFLRITSLQLFSTSLSRVFLLLKQCTNDQNRSETVGNSFSAFQNVLLHCHL